MTTTPDLIVVYDTNPALVIDTDIGVNYLVPISVPASPGATGAPGAAGTQMDSGSGAPSSGTGSNGDFYIDKTHSILYGPKASGAWPSPGISLIGPTGATGAGLTGATGATGAASTVPGPTGPAGATGAASTIPGPTGPAGTLTTGGSVTLEGATSGTTLLVPVAIASGTMTVPAGTDTLATQTYVNSAVSSIVLSSSARELVAATDVAAVFVYDTTRDADGGAWRARCGGASYVNETLNTSTRGSRASIPSKILAVARAASLTLYDLDDTACSMWMVFTIGAGFFGVTGSVKRIVFLDGIMAVATSSRFEFIDFVQDCAFQALGGVYQSATNIANRNSTLSQVAIAGSAPATTSANDVALARAPVAQPSPTRVGLPTPIIGIAGTAGAWVLRQDFYGKSASSSTAVISCCFDSRGNFWTLTASTLSVCRPVDYQTASFNIAALGSFSSTALAIGTLAVVRSTADGVVVGGSTGAIEIVPDYTNLANSLFARKIGTTRNTGYLFNVSATVLALSESSSDLSNVTTASDQSAAGNNMLAVGTVERAIVSTGSELAGYTNFSASNYLRQAHSASFDFGTGDFGLFCWLVMPSDPGAVTLIDRSTTDGGAYFRLSINSSNQVVATISDGTNVATATGLGVHGAKFIHAGLVRRGSSIEVWVNGAKTSASASSVGSLSNASALLTLGATVSASSPLNATNILALIRISAYAPLPAQIRRMQADELKIMSGGKCLLQGSGSVQAIAYDPDQNIIALAQSTGGTDLFLGLSNSTTQLSTGFSGSNNHKFVSFADSDLSIGTAAGVDLWTPSLGLREGLTKRLPRMPYDPSRATLRNVTSDATPKVIASFIVAEGKAYRYEAKVAAVSYDDGAMTEQVVYKIDGIVTRPIGANVAENGAATTIFEVTSSQDCSASVDTTNELFTIVGTGKASTTEQWVVALQLDDLGLGMEA